jgi:3-oxoadipate enol-lactonase
MPHADVNGQRTWFEDTGGDRPPVLFAHGFLMDTEMWGPQVDALRGDFRCITYDERGWGRTEFDGLPFDYWDLADDAVGLLDHLGIERAAVVGMSQGGFLGLRAALRYPDRVQALVLVDSQSGTEDPATVGAYQGMIDDWMVNGPANVGEIVSGLIIGDPAHEPAWRAKWAARDPKLIEHPGACLLNRDDVTDRVGEVTCPTLVVHGTADQAIPIATARELCDALPDCRGIVEVPGAAHAANLTHPDVVNPPLREFLLSVLA